MIWNQWSEIDRFLAKILLQDRHAVNIYDSDCDDSGFMMNCFFTACQQF